MNRVCLDCFLLAIGYNDALLAVQMVNGLVLLLVFLPLAVSAERIGIEGIRIMSTGRRQPRISYET